MRFLSIGLLALVWFVGNTSAEAARKRCPSKKSYVVRPGDSLWSISQKLFGNPRMYRKIYRCNNFPGKPPYLLKPGSVIYVPGNAPRHDAQVKWFKRNVKTKPPKSIDWHRLRSRQKPLLWRMYKVSTGSKSFAGVHFEDRAGSRLRMREESLLLIYGDSLLKSKVTRRFKTRVRLEKGVIRGGLGSMFKQAGLDIQTPSSKVKLRSKDSQIQVDKKKTSIVSVYQGNAKVRARGKEVKVLSGYGTYVKKGRRPAKPMRLPQKMSWKAPVVVVLVPRGQKGNVEARWKKNSRAARYRLELSHSSTFNRFFFDNDRIPGKLGGFVIKRLAPGTYWARVSAIDKNKLEGRPSKPLRIEVVGLETSRVLVFNRVQREYQVVGLLELKAPGDKGRLLELSVDNKPFRNFSTPLRLSKPGLYDIRFRSTGSTRIASQFKLRILKIHARMEPVKTAQKRPGPPVRVKFKVFVRKRRKTPNGIAFFTKMAFPQGLQLMAYPGGKQAIRYDKASRSFVASVPLPKARSLKQLVVRLSWFGGDLAEGRIPLLPPPLPKYKVELTPTTPLPRKPKSATLQFRVRDEKGKAVRPASLALRVDGEDKTFDYDAKTQTYSFKVAVPQKASIQSLPVAIRWKGGELLSQDITLAKPLEKPFGWPHGWVSADWGSLSMVPPSNAADIRSTLGLTSTVSGNNTRLSNDNTYLRLALRGTLALLEQKLGLDAELPWFQLNLLEDSATLGKLGDPRLGARYAFYKEDNLVMAAGLRFTLPLGEYIVQAAQGNANNIVRDRRMPVEASFLLRWSPKKWLHLHTHQTLQTTIYFSGGVSLAYSTALGASIRPLKWMSAGLEFHAYLPFVDPLNTAFAPALAVSGALRFHFDRFQVALVGGAGLNDAARSTFGSYTVGLTMDLRF